MLQGSWFVLVS